MATINKKRGDTFDYTSSGTYSQGSTAGCTAYFTAKRARTDLDEDAVMALVKIVPDDATAAAGKVNFVKSAAEMNAEVPNGTYFYDIQIVSADAVPIVETIEDGQLVIDGDITKTMAFLGSVPQVVAAAVPAQHTSSLTIPVQTFTAVNATHYKCTYADAASPDPTPPGIADAGWSAGAAPVGVAVPSEGDWLVYFWVHDGTSVSALFAPQRCTVDLPSTISWSVSGVNVNEGALVTLTAQRASNLFGALQASVAQVTGVAVQNSDYSLSGSTLVWVSGDGADKQIIAAISADGLTEGLESFGLRLTIASGQGSYGSNRDINVNIVDTSQGLDAVPDAFSFVDEIAVPLSTLKVSSPITVSGINTPVPISVVGGEYDINASGSWTSLDGAVIDGDTVRARHTSSALNSTQTNTTVTIGSVSDTYTTTTESAAAGGGTELFSASFTAPHAQVEVTSAQLSGFDNVVAYGGGYTGTPPLAYYEGIADAGPYGEAVAQLTCRAAAWDYNLGWDVNPTRTLGYGDEIYIAFDMKLVQGFFGGVVGQAFELKMMDIPGFSDVNADRILLHLYGRRGGSSGDPWPSHYLEAEGINWTETYYGIDPNEFNDNDYIALALTKDDSSDTFTPPVPLTFNVWYPVIIRMLNESSAGAGDGEMELFVGANTAVADPMRHSLTTNASFKCSETDEIKFGAYVAGNSTGQDEVVQFKSFKVLDGMPANFVPWDVGSSANLPFIENCTKQNMLTSNSPAGVWHDGGGSVSYSTAQAFNGRRAMAFPLVANAENNNYREFRFGTHSGIAGTECPEVNLAFAFRFEFTSGGFVTTAASNKIFTIDIRDPANADRRRYQVYAGVESDGELAIFCAVFNATTGAWQSETRYGTGVTISAGQWYRGRLRAVCNTPGVADGILNLSLGTGHGNATENVINLASVDIRGSTNFTFNRLIATSHCGGTSSGVGAGTLYQDAYLLSSADPGYNI